MGKFIKDYIYFCGATGGVVIGLLCGFLHLSLLVFLLLCVTYAMSLVMVEQRYENKAKGKDEDLQ